MLYLTDTDPETKTEIDQRVAQNERKFYVAKQLQDPADPCAASSGFRVTIRRRRMGIDLLDGDTQREILPPVFDNLSIVAPYAAIAYVGSRGALFGLPDGQPLTDYTLQSAQPLTRGRGLLLTDLCDPPLEGWYNPTAQPSQLSTLNSQLSTLLLPAYELVSRTAGLYPYFWVKLHGTFHFIEAATGRFLPMPSLCMAYNSPDGLFGLLPDGRAACLTPSGVADPTAFRRAVVEAGGHLTLDNPTLNRCDRADVYGNLL